MSKNIDWLILKMRQRSNPAIIRKDAVSHMAPDPTDEFRTLLWLKGQEKALFIDQTTGSIEEQL